MSRNNRFKTQQNNQSKYIKTIKIDKEVEKHGDTAEEKLLSAISAYLKEMNLNRNYYHSIMICLECDLILLNERTEDSRVTEMVMKNYKSAEEFINKT